MPSFPPVKLIPNSLGAKKEHTSSQIVKSSFSFNVHAVGIALFAAGLFLLDLSAAGTIGSLP
jgi:hypothetical protein